MNTDTRIPDNHPQITWPQVADDAVWGFIMALIVWIIFK